MIRHKLSLVGLAFCIPNGSDTAFLNARIVLV
jgi:hypothetical protein